MPRNPNPGMVYLTRTELQMLNMEEEAHKAVLARHRQKEAEDAEKKRRLDDGPDTAPRNRRI